MTHPVLLLCHLSLSYSLQQEETEKEIARLKVLANGEVTVKYNMYAEKFKIEDYKMTAAQIDDLYGLSDAMPGFQKTITHYRP